MRPMLAATCLDLETLRFPLMASPKLDGIRAIVMGGVVLSRTMKPIPNPQVQDRFRKYKGCDGELIVGDPRDHDVYRRTVSHCMSQAAPTELRFYAFDKVDSPQNFKARHNSVPPEIRLAHKLVKSVEELMKYEDEAVAAGYEGIITRAPEAEYKNGRSTMNEQGMVKIKRFSDDEAEVVGMEELMHNANEATTNVQGYTERTSHKANKVGRNTMGALICQWQGIQFKIGTGFTDNERHIIWNSNPVGKVAKFKFLKVGMKVAPRHPVFLGWRDPKDR